MKFENIPHYDIIPPVPIQISPYLYVIIMACLIIGIAALMLWKRFNAERRLSISADTKAVKYEALKSVNLKDPKRAAYEISALGYELSKEDKMLSELYTHLNRLLEKHKYALNVEPFSSETKEAYEKFCAEVYEKIS